MYRVVYGVRISRPPPTRGRFQIKALGTLLAVGVGALGFDQQPGFIMVIVGAALATQWGLSTAFGIAPFDPLSPLITALSLSILLRAPGPGYLVLAACAAIASKFLIRIDGQHIFNPANFGNCVLLFAGAGWISPAQWGSKTNFAFLFVCLAGLVLSKAKRADIALAVLGTFAAILFARAAYLGDPWPIPMKQMQSGALLLFYLAAMRDTRGVPLPLFAPPFDQLARVQRRGSSVAHSLQAPGRACARNCAASISIDRAATTVSGAHPAVRSRALPHSALSEPGTFGERRVVTLPRRGAVGVTSWASCFAPRPS